MNLPTAIAALKRGEQTGDFSEVLRGTKYEGCTPGEWAYYPGKFLVMSEAGKALAVTEPNGLLFSDAKANAATVTVLREAVRELTTAANELVGELDYDYSNWDDLADIRAKFVAVLEAIKPLCDNE